jgi:uncharacterized iron-regulated membrane protein
LQLGAQKTFFTTMRQLHRWLLGDFKRDGSFSLGKTVVGVSTLLFVFVLLSGSIIWVPRSRKALRLRLQIKTRYGWRRFWHDLHVAGGIYAALLLLAMALTGLTYSFGWYRAGFYRVFGVEAPQMGHGGGARAPQAAVDSTVVVVDSVAIVSAANTEGRGAHRHGGRGGRPAGGGGRPEGRGGRPESAGENRRYGGGSPQSGWVNYRQWQAVVDQLKAQYLVDYQRITIQDGRASVSLSDYGNSRAADNYTFDTQTGDITEATYYKDTDRSGKMRGWIYAVHVGSWGGVVTRILAFLAALLGAALPLTGYYMWVRRRWSRGRIE